MSDESSTTTPPKPVEIIYSCSVCHKTISEIYSQVENDHGFRDENDTNDGQPVTKLWMTECAHLTCSEHLDGGGVPIHPAGQQPRVPCPHCSKEGDSSLKKIYGIRGFREGQFDAAIPTAYFDTPPVEFSGTNDVTYNALAFHYRQLCSFGASAFTNYNDAKHKWHIYHDRAKTAEKAAHDATQQVEVLKKRVRDLEHCEAELAPWKEREAEIKHYLNTFTQVVDDNNKLREQFDRLGYVVPKQTWSLKSPAPDHAPHPRKPQTTKNADENSHDSQSSRRMSQGYHPQPITMIENAPPALLQARPQPMKAQQLPFESELESSSSHTLSGPAKSVQNLHTVHSVVDAISRKRAADDGGQDIERATKSPRLEKPTSRGMMPPPPLPFRRPTGLSEIPANIASSQSKQPAPAFVRPDQRSLPKKITRPVVSESIPPDAADRQEAHSLAGNNLNIFRFQESSPTNRAPVQDHAVSDESMQEPIMDPRRVSHEHMQKQNHGPWQDRVRHVDEGDSWRPNVVHQNVRPKQAIMQYSDSPQQRHQLSNFVHSDPGSVMYSPYSRTQQHLSDPSRAPPTRSQVKKSVPRQSVDDISSPFFVGGNKVPTRNGRLTLPSHAKMGGSSQAIRSMNNLSFIGEPHNPITHQRIRTAATQHNALQPRAAMPPPGRQPNNGFVQRRPAQNMNMSVQRGPSRSHVNTPFRTPLIQNPSEPLYRGHQQQQLPQHYFAREVATPQQAPRRYMAGTPVLLPSRAGTMASRGMGNDSRFAGFAYSGGHEGQYDSRGLLR